MPQYDIQSPGANAGMAMQKYLLDQAARDRQAQLDAQALAHQQEGERLAREEDKRAADLQTAQLREHDQQRQIALIKEMGRGASLSPEQGNTEVGRAMSDAAAPAVVDTVTPEMNPAKQQGIYPGIVASSAQTPSIGSSAGAPGRISRGTPAEQKTAEESARQEAYIQTLPEGSRERRLLEYELQTNKNAPAGLFEPAVKAPRDLYLSRTGAMTMIGADGKQQPLPANFVRRAEDVVHQEPAPSTAGAVTVNLGDQGLDMTAKMYAKTGQLPPLGMGTSAAAMRGKIIERASQYDPATDTFSTTNTAPDLASNKAGYASDSAALSQLNKNYQAVGAFKATANKNAALLDEMLDKIPSGHAPTFINMPIRAAASAFGDTDMARFNALRLSVQNEYARLVSNPNLVGVMTDQSRKEMESVLDPSATVGQIRAALQALKDEADSRETGFHDQIQALHDRIKGGPAPVAPPPTAAHPNETPAARAKRLYDQLTVK